MIHVHPILILVAGVALITGWLFGYGAGREDGPQERPLQVPPLDAGMYTEQHRKLEQNFKTWCDDYTQKQRESPWYAIGWMYGMGLCNPAPNFFSHVEYQLGYLDARQERDRRGY